ncbi:glutamate mutase L [Nocardioides sp. Bht2]|uniref:glutamate mutase L n=1 Tax=Nocardioides sp. Bht2 TaxID=3392297 RepID=UPI0039B697AD
MTAPVVDTAVGSAGVVLCVDYGSTFTKVVLIDLARSRIVAATSHRTTIDTDLIDGFDACRARLAEIDPAAATAPAYAASSAGGGLRILVVGNERLVTAEAGHRVALGSGGKVVGVIAAAEGLAFAAQIAEAEPDLILLVGGTDGGNPAPLVAAAEEIGRSGWHGPVVVAGNLEAQPKAVAALGSRPVVTVANVMPQIGVLEPGPARAAVRACFLDHVIGGKQLSNDPRFTAMLLGATPDVVLRGMELLAADSAVAGDLLLVDVGGATTDVYSVVEVDPEDAGLSREVVATTPLNRTVEADLGMRWSAVETVAAGIEHGWGTDADLPAAALRRGTPSWLPTTAEDQQLEERLASTAIHVAVRRHTGGSARSRRDPHRPDQSATGPQHGPDLRSVAWVIGSGGVLRTLAAGSEPVAGQVIAAALVAPASARLPEQPQVVVDRELSITAAGLLLDAYPATAARLARGLLESASSRTFDGGIG